MINSELVEQIKEETENYDCVKSYLHVLTGEVGVPDSRRSGSPLLARTLVATINNIIAKLSPNSSSAGLS